MAKKFFLGLAVCLILFMMPGMSLAAVGEWTWMSGSNTSAQLGAYGIKGIPAAANVPGARQGSISWTDSDGNFWLFGGLGYGTTTTSGHLNDLWRYDPITNEWTWMRGSKTVRPGWHLRNQGFSSHRH